MRTLRRILQRSADREIAADNERLEVQSYNVWERVFQFAAEIRGSPFMAEMRSHLDEHGSHGLMGDLDCATLYGLTRWLRPTKVVESGGYVGMSAAFILKALADEGLTQSKLYSLEMDRNCPHGALIPCELRAQFVPLCGRIEDFVRRNELPETIDMFLHDSSHRYRHMLWEFREFWSRLRDGGLLVSHDVHFNPAFAEFVAKTHARDRKGVRNSRDTTHYEWGRWGYIGFVIKKGD